MIDLISPLPPFQWLRWELVKKETQTMVAAAAATIDPSQLKNAHT